MLLLCKKKSSSSWLISWILLLYLSDLKNFNTIFQFLNWIMEKGFHFFFSLSLSLNVSLSLSLSTYISYQNCNISRRNSYNFPFVLVSILFWRIWGASKNHEVYSIERTVKPLYNDHPWDPRVVAVVDRWSLFRCHLSNRNWKWGHKVVVVVDRWSLFRGGR